MVKNTQRITGLEPFAAMAGLFIDQKLGDARALIPSLDAIPAAPHDDTALLKALAAWCDRYTPLVGLSGMDGLMLDISGCAHLFGGETAMMEEICARLTATGLHVDAGLADTVGAAWALARFGDIRRCTPGDTGPLMPLPLTALRLDEATVTGLKRVGFRKVGCIADLPRAPLARRFGERLMTRLDQMLGRKAENITPLRPPADLTAEKKFFDPITHGDDITRAIGLLAGALGPMLVDKGVGARGLELALFRVDGVVTRLDVAAADPLRDPGRIGALFRERIAGLRTDLDAGFGFDLVKLAVTRADPFRAGQSDLMGHKAPDEGFRALVDRLGARLGPERVCAFAGADTHIPERSTGTLPVTRQKPGMPTVGPMANAPVPPLTRPLWLLSPPERIEAVAGVPEGPPRRFRWRKVAYAVARAEGPERIACEWWRDGRAMRTRDYYRIEAAEGHRFWMFRHGLYSREAERPEWYMHGLFA